MKINDLLLGRVGCECGVDHHCPVDRVIIGENACDELPHLVKDYKNILLVADENTFRACGATVEVKLSEKIADKVIFSGKEILVPDERAMEAISSRVTEETDLIIGVGSGVINDLCKIVSFNAGLGYFIVATAPSMDGYASKGAALILGGMKVTLNANVPRAIIADTRVLADAPFGMIQAGYGDIIGKLSCLNDWKLSSCVNGEYLCHFVIDATYEAVEKVISLAKGIKARERDAMGSLMEALVIVGILMAYVGNSRPASGSEHHLSHYFEIVGIERGEDYLAHGIDVCFSAVETAKIREKILAIEEIDKLEYSFDKEEYECEIGRVYGSVASGVLELQSRLGWYEIDRISEYKKKWNEIREILSTCPSSEQMLELCQRVGLNIDEFYSLYGENKISDAYLYAKDLKDRYSVLWLYYDLLKSRKVLDKNV